MDIEIIFAELFELQKQIFLKKISINSELIKDTERISEGKLSRVQQEKDNKKRHLELQKLCNEFEVKLNDTADKLLGEVAKNNPYVQKRLNEIKSNTVDESVICSYGNDRITQLKDLYQELNP